MLPRSNWRAKNMMQEGNAMRQSSFTESAEQRVSRECPTHSSDEFSFLFGRPLEIWVEAMSPLVTFNWLVDIFCVFGIPDAVSDMISRAQLRIRAPGRARGWRIAIVDGYEAHVL